MTHIYTVCDKKYGGLETKEKKCKYTLSQELKINKLLEHLNDALLKNNLLDTVKPYKFRDVELIVQNYMSVNNITDLTVALTELKQQLEQSDYIIKQAEK